MSWDYVWILLGLAIIILGGIIIGDGGISLRTISGSALFVSGIISVIYGINEPLWIVD
jgi:uncharacterized membrane protein HdeD (DUF308 family)